MNKQFVVKEETIERIVREVVKRILSEEIESYNNELPDKKTVIDVADDDLMNKAMAVMDASLNEQELPKVGIFWYSPQIKDVFGVVSVDAKKMAETDNRDLVTCTELHKYVWKKNYNYYKNHDGNDLFNGDYKYTPRGRIFYDKELEVFYIMVGTWINKFPEAIPKIKEAFNLNRNDIISIVKIGEHWEIGMGYGD